MFFAFKIAFTACVVAFVSWLSGKKPELAGFITALPLVTLIALVYSQAEWEDSQNTIKYAKSILLAMPVTLSFYIPFFLEPKFGYGFWGSYVFGISLLTAGFFLHRYVTTTYF